VPGERHHIVRRPAHDTDQRILPVIPAFAFHQLTMTGALPRRCWRGWPRKTRP
jgi:hypothetical protein